MQGIELFSTVALQVNHEAEQDDDDDDSRNDISDGPEESRSKQTSDHKLDACNVRVYPPLNSEYESLRLPVNYMHTLGVHYKETKDGLVIHGKCHVSGDKTHECDPSRITSSTSYPTTLFANAALEVI
jgi:hypothetical protein